MRNHSAHIGTRTENKAMMKIGVEIKLLQCILAMRAFVFQPKKIKNAKMF